MAGWDEKERFKDVSSTPVKVDTFSDKMKKLEEMLRLYNPSNKGLFHDIRFNSPAQYVI